MHSFVSCQIRKKAVWGRSLVISLMAVLLVVSAAPAEAQPGGSKGVNKAAAKAARQQHHKLDKALNEVADGNGSSDVIVEFHNGSDDADAVRSNGGTSGRRLGILNAR